MQRQKLRSLKHSYPTLLAHCMLIGVSQTHVTRDLQVTCVFATSSTNLINDLQSSFQFLRAFYVVDNRRFVFANNQKS